MSILLVYGNAFLGLLAICLQISALAVSKGASQPLRHWPPDLVSVGIWGGVYLLMFSFILKRKKIGDRITILILTTYAFLVGCTLVGIPSWSIDRYQEYIKDCKVYTHEIFFTIPLCNRVAIDSLMIVCGILTVIINALTVLRASAFVKK